MLTVQIPAWRGRACESSTLTTCAYYGLTTAGLLYTRGACFATVAAGYVAHKMNGMIPAGTELHLVQKYLSCQKLRKLVSIIFCKSAPKCSKNIDESRHRRALVVHDWEDITGDKHCIFRCGQPRKRRWKDLDGGSFTAFSGMH